MVDPLVPPIPFMSGNPLCGMEAKHKLNWWGSVLRGKIGPVISATKLSLTSVVIMTHSVLGWEPDHHFHSSLPHDLNWGCPAVMGMKGPVSGVEMSPPKQGGSPNAVKNAAFSGQAK